MASSVTTGADEALRAIIEKAKKLGGAQALPRALGPSRGRRAKVRRAVVRVEHFARRRIVEAASIAQGQPLVKAAELSRSIKTRVSSKGFELYTNVPYAAVHQFGASTKARWQARTKTGRFKSKKSPRRRRAFSVRRSRERLDDPRAPVLPRRFAPHVVARSLRADHARVLQRVLRWLSRGSNRSSTQ